MGAVLSFLGEEAQGQFWLKRSGVGAVDCVCVQRSTEPCDGKRDGLF